MLRQQEAAWDPNLVDVIHLGVAGVDRDEGVHLARVAQQNGITPAPAVALDRDLLEAKRRDAQGVGDLVQLGKRHSISVAPHPHDDVGNAADQLKNLVASSEE